MPRARPTAAVLHGGWIVSHDEAPAGFAIWGEQSPNVRVRPRHPRKRALTPPSAPAHPFALSDDGVRHALSTMGLTRWAVQTNVRQAFACLPSAAEGPLRSSEAVDPARVSELRFAEWEVSVIVLDEVSSVSLLPRIAAAASDPAMLGDDLRAWIVAARFALSLLVRQRFVPRVGQPGEDDEVLVARWAPVVDEAADRATLQAIEAGIPSAGVSLTWTPDTPRATPRDALADYLAAVIDGVARRSRPSPGDTTHVPAMVSAWLAALGRDDATVQLQGDASRTLRRNVTAWTDQSGHRSADADAAFRLCFRLVPPAPVAPGGPAPGGPGGPASERPWRLEYLLQATDDPSLLVPVEEVWRQRGQTARLLTRRFDQPQERVLAALGRASRVFPPIVASLREPRPEACALTTREAADLVRDKALLLKASGYGVLLPGLDSRLNVRLRLRPPRQADPSRTDGLGLLTFSSVVGYDWQLALGDQVLTPEEFETLAHLKEPLVQLRGQWVDVRPDQIERALAFIQKHQSDQLQLADALSTALAPTALDGVPVASVEASGWVEALLEDVRQGTRTEVEGEPPGFMGKLRGYQQRGVAWMATLQRYGLGALLADDMGLGKALSDDTRILTPTGWKTMREVSVGDEVINAAGGASRVTAVYPQGEKELYQVVFSDGTSVECCREHLWELRSACAVHEPRSASSEPRRRGHEPGSPGAEPEPRSPGAGHEPRGACAGRVLPLEAFMHDLCDEAGRPKHVIPMVRPIAFAERSEREPLADAYALGARLGSAEACVPDAYKFASVAARVALLQGLLDAHGCVRETYIEYTTPSRRLAQDLAFIAQSLGGTARILESTPNTRVAVNLPPEIQPFRLPGKAATYVGRCHTPPSRAIVDVVPVGKKSARCITVDSPDGLYVIEHCIVTHNTAQIIALLLRRQARPTLVICPTSVVGNWRHELTRFAPELSVLVHHGPSRASEDELGIRAVQHDVVLSTYSLLHRDEAALARIQWDGLVLDEAQNIKNASTRAAQATRAMHARWRVALTGTPVENRLADLWSIFQTINPGYLGSADEFRREFALPIERASDADAAARLKALTAPFILRRVKTDRAVIADLPEKQEMKVYCSLTREQATLYEAVLQDTMRRIAESEGIQRRGLVLSLLTRLKQVCDHPALLMHDGSPLAGRSGKLARLGEMLEEVIANDERALIFTQYAEMGRLLVQYLGDTLQRGVLFLHGGTPIAERDRMVADFQTDTHGAPIFILSLKAGGTGLNLTRANHVFHFDRWWNPAVENQATDRAFRIGQTRNVQVHKYVCAGTFEETLDSLIERKVQLAESIVGTSEAWITEMSTDELRQMFRLRHDEAVPEDD